MTIIPNRLTDAPPNADPITADVLRAAVHDLKGPSGRLRVLTELVNRGEGVDQDTRTLMNHIADSARAMDLVIEALRRYSELCMRPLHAEPVDLAVPLGSAIANLTAGIEASGAQIAYGALPAIEGDNLLITWMFEELLGNAMRFRGASPPQIRVDALPAGENERLISVCDNGQGIEAGMLERVFRPFKKVSSGGGAGLGLTICRKIAELHGGRIWAEPRAGGAEIRIQFRA